jgi:predicted MFS family arabinose efflux permease
MGVAGSRLLGLIAGVILMDLGVQSGHVSNQTRIYSIDPAARSRLNMVYMSCYFIGGGLGSYLGALSWHAVGWWGVCGFGAVVMSIAIVTESIYGRKAEREAAR